MRSGCQWHHWCSVQGGLRWCPSGTSELLPPRTWELSFKHHHSFCPLTGWQVRQSWISQRHPFDFNTQALTVICLRELTVFVMLDRVAWYNSWMNREYNHCITMVLHWKFWTVSPGSGFLGSNSVEAHSNRELKEEDILKYFMWSP